VLNVTGISLTLLHNEKQLHQVNNQNKCVIVVVVVVVACYTTLALNMIAVANQTIVYMTFLASNCLQNTCLMFGHYMVGYIYIDFMVPDSIKRGEFLD
jgi:hypothetical protein